MTTITLVTNDQALSVVLKPLVASGDYNLVKVQVEFDSAWERYPVRSAVFRTQKGAEAEILLTDNECIIPHEVLAEPGTLFIAMRGVTYSGNVIKTTEEVKYKVVQGAKDIASTTAPSHNMFAQYCAAIADGIAPHLQTMGEKADAKLDEIESEADAAIGRYEAMAGSYIRMKTGSYTGTGTFGADNPNALEFDFEPRMVIIFKESYKPGCYTTASSDGAYNDIKQEFLFGGSSFYVNGGSSNAYTRYSMNGKTLSWHSEYSGTAAHMGASMQMNTENITYHYIAIGV